MEKQIGKYSFIAGVVIAVLLGLAIKQLEAAQDWLFTILVLLGLVVGFLNVSGKETKDFLLVTVALVVVAYIAGAQMDMWKSEVQFVGKYLSGIFSNIVAFVVPASVVVALKETWELARGE
ncbi:AtpZ/AtpI family protein [Candidatus Woesearchaeota archaeon]|nr:AtpZ/AtpI family protein [Candidatus Woesearchaeota archaeon]